MIAKVNLPDGLKPQYFGPIAASVCEYFGQDEVVFTFLYSGDNGGVLYLDLAAEYEGRTVCCCVSIPRLAAESVVRRGLHAVRMTRPEPCPETRFVALAGPPPDIQLWR